MNICLRSYILVILFFLFRELVAFRLEKFYQMKSYRNNLQKIVDKIFQPFFTTKPTEQGTVLGLNFSYDIIKASGGEIRVESTQGEGTVFY